MRILIIVLGVGLCTGLTATLVVLVASLLVQATGGGNGIIRTTPLQNGALQESVDTVSETLKEFVPEALISLAATTLVVADETEVSFQLAKPFKIAVAAEGIGKARFMAMSPDGRMFVPDLVDYKLSHEGKVYILEDFNEETKRFETKHEYLSGLRGPNSIAFYTDEEGKHWLYLALTAHLIRYPYMPGDTAPSGEPEIIFEFPNTQSPEAKSVVWHITRTIHFKGGRAYVTVGSGCNACEQISGEMRGMLFSMNPDGSGVEIVADGLRNSVGFTWVGNTLFATANGVDHLGADRPDELLYKIEESGKHYGWPYCYETDGEQLEDTSYFWTKPVVCTEMPHSFAAFPPRSAPLGLAYFKNAHPMLMGTLLVALHGSFDSTLQSGYQIVRVRDDGTQEIFMDGFQRADGTVQARPVDIVQKDQNSFFVTDDFGGRVYYIYAQ